MLRHQQQPRHQLRHPEAPPPEIIDPREEMRKISRKVQEEMNNSTIVTNAQEMGFEVKLIKAAVKR